jgi:hypothetical protein
MKKLAPLAGGDERFAFDVDGLASARGADDQPGAALHRPRDDDQAVLVGPAEVPVDPHAQGNRAGVVAPHVGGVADRGGHALAGVPLVATDLGGVDRLPAPGQVQRCGQQPHRDAQRHLRPQEHTRHGQVDDRLAELADQPQVADEMMRQRRADPAFCHDHRGQSGG